jgi:hypothetical protein
MSYVTELRPADVLFGRGSGPNDHEGNIRFRQRVADRKDEYLATNHRMTKAQIAKEIVDSVWNENGRFLKKAEDTASLASFSVPAGVDVYEMVDGDTIMEKAKQALRQNTLKAEAKPKLKQALSGRQSVAEPHEDNPEDFEPIPLVISNNYHVPADQQPQLIYPPVTVSHVLPVALANPPATIHWDVDNSRIPMPEHINTHVNWDVDNSRIPMPENINTHVNAAAGQGHEAADWELDNSRIPMPEHSNTHANAAVGQGHVAPDSNMSMAQLPQLSNEYPSSTNPRELVRQKSGDSMRMDELLDSFTKMKATTKLDEQKRMMASVETMGTIDQLPEGSMNDMSLGSSTFSFFRGNDSMVMNTHAAAYEGTSQSSSITERVTPSNPHGQGGTSNVANSLSQSTSTCNHSYLTSESSMSLTDVWSNEKDIRSKKSNLTHSGITGEVDNSVKRVMDEVRREEEAARNGRLGIFQPNPRQIVLEDDAQDFNVSDLGGSTFLKAATHSTNTFGNSTNTFGQSTNTFGNSTNTFGNSNNTFGHDLPNDSIPHH